MTSQKKPSPAIPHQPVQAAPGRGARKNNRVIVGVALLLLASLGVRVWYDRHPLPPLPVSLQDIERRAREQPGSIAAQLDWGVLLRQQGRLEEANQAFTAASRIDPKDARPYTGLALVALAQNQLDQAANFFRQSVQRDPSDAGAWRGLGTVYERLHRPTDAISAYEKAMQLNPNDADTVRQLGSVYTEQDQIFRGHDLLVRAAQLNPSDLQTQRILGENAFLQGRFPESREALEKALTQEPDNPVILSLLAQISVKLDPSPQGLALAEQRARRALALKQTGSAHMALGQIYLARRQYVSAIAEFKRAIAIYPDLVLAYVSLSQAYNRTGQADLARKTDIAYQATLIRQKRASRNVGYKPLPWR